MRVIVIGRGVFGLAAALSLKRKGHQVVVVGQRDPGASSEDISRIIRNDYAYDTHHTSWASEALDGWSRWNEEIGQPIFRRTGLANLTVVPLSPDSFAGASFASLEAAERLDGVAISDLLPFVTPGRFVDGYVNSQAGWADASAALRHMERLCEEAGVGIVPERVARIGDGWVGLMGDGLLRADRTIVAAGAWTPRLVPETAPLLTPAGQPVLYLRPRTPERFVGVPVWALDLERSGFYGFPLSPDGLVKVGHHGAGVTNRLEIRTVSDRVVDAFRAFFRDFVPELVTAAIDRTRVCFYCDAPGGRFLIDRVPGRGSLIVAAGGSGHGFKFAPVIGDLIAAVALDEEHPRRALTAWRDPGPKGDAARAGRIGDLPR